MELTKYWDALNDVKDPEIPTVSVIEMGVINHISAGEKGQLLVEMTPTFIGCPALEMIRDHIISRLMMIDGITQVRVRFVHDPPWTSNRITKEGQEKLKEFGIASPVAGKDSFIPPCPYCDQNEGRVENLFGPTACRAIFYCKSCNQPFEGVKRI